MKNENKKENYFENLKGFERAMPVTFAVLAVFTAVCVFSKGTGFLGDGIGTLLRGLFSLGGYFLPFLLAIHALCYAEDVNKKRLIPRLCFSATIVILVSVIEYAVCLWNSSAVFTPAAFYSEGINGGFIGCVIGFVLVKLIGHIGAVLFASAILAIFAIFFYADRTGELGQKAMDVAGIVFGFLAKTEGDVKQKIADKKAEKAEREEEEHRSRSDELLNDSFFNSAGVENLKIDELGIGADIPDEESAPEVTARPQRKRDPDKPLDLSYGMEIPTPTEEISEEPAEEVTETVANEAPVADVYGIEDSAEKVFTKAFDPLDFATSEKIASKPSSRSIIEEELDDINAPTAKNSRNDRNARIAEFEKRKQMWNERHKAVSEQSENADAPHTNPASEDAVPAQIPFNNEHSTPSYTPRESEKAHTFSAPARNEIPKEVNTYTSYSSTQTTYTQPIKTVEFTINSDAAPVFSAPIESNEISKTYEKGESIDKSTEDVAAFIAEKIARANPAYARSANEMVTYTKVTPSPNELPSYEHDSSYDSLADKLIADSHAEIDFSSLALNDTAETAEDLTENDILDSATTDDIDSYFPTQSVVTSDEIVTSAEGEQTQAANILESAEFAFDEVEETVGNSESDIFADIDRLSEAEIENLMPLSEEAENVPDEAIADDSETEASNTYVSENAKILTEAEAEITSAVDTSSTKAIYERAAGFVSGLTFDDTSAPKEFVTEFKPYEPPTVVPAEIVYENGTTDTLKVERTMLPPTMPSSAEIARDVDDAMPTLASQTAETVITFESTAPVAAVADTLTAPTAIPEPITVEGPAVSPISEATAEATVASSLETTLDLSDFAPTPEFTVVDEESFNVSEESAQTESVDEKIDWEGADDFSLPKAQDEEQTSSEISFSEDSAEEEENEADAQIPESFEATPEEDDVITEEIPPEKQNPDVLKMREMFPFLNPIGTTAEPAAQSAVTEIPSAPIEEEDVPPFDDAVIKPAPKAALVSMEDVKKEEKKAKKPDYSNYEFPPIDLLAKEDAFSDENIQAEIQENADKLIETLASFGVTASIKGVDRGPRITRYEVVPAKGVKVSSILNLQDDIALNLAAGSIRMEAPIPGKSAVGIEIPNKKSSTVRLRNLLETEDFQSTKSKTAICIGRDVAGQPVFGDVAKMPHLLIAGATGMGKSVCINSLMISILYKARPDEVKFIMIDPKQVEFTMYNGIPHLLVPVVSDAKQAAGALMWAVEEMERRYNLLNPLCVRNIEAYNEKVMADPSLGEPMSKIVIVIDEFADLMLQVKDPVETLVMRIAQKARAAGIHLIIGTQRPSVNVITGVIKANVPSRISCKVMSNVDSKTVLDSAGAEKLLDRGDMLFAPAGSPKPHRVQGAFVADGEVEAIMAHLKKFSDGSNYDSDVMEEIERAAQKCSKKGGGNSGDYEDGDDEVHGEGYLNDRQFLDAVEVAVNTRKISTSLIQRKLSIGYGKAAKFIDIMEDMGIVGEANGQRPREVLISPDEWREKLARATLD